jgi:superfamily II DNA or RNA helicase
MKGADRQPDVRFCSCFISRKETCEHIRDLVSLYKVFKQKFGDRSPEEIFRSSLWYRLTAIMADGCRETAGSVRLRFVDRKSGRLIEVLGGDRKPMLFYLSQASDADRFRERLGQTSKEDSIPTRGALLDELADMTASPQERIMQQMGSRTIRQVLEGSVWYRIFYHGFREFEGDEITFHPAIEEPSGLFTVTCRRTGAPVFRMVIPSDKVKKLLIAFKEFLPNQHGLAIHPVPLKSIFRISATTELDLEVRPIVQVLQEGGEARFFERQDVERFRYGDLVYVRELGLLAELEPPGDMQRRFVSPARMVLKKSQIPTFLQDFEEELRDGPHIIDASVKNLRIFSRFEKVEINPSAIDRNWCWLSVRYGFGSGSIDLSEILRARKEGQRFVSTAEGWVDCLSKDFEGLDPLLGHFAFEGPDSRGGRMRLSRMDLFRLKAATRSLEVAGDGEAVSLLKRMLELKPARPMGELKGLSSTLRPYQKVGAEWLLFLFENGLGGLLCDDMGMGKTHEVMAFMVSLVEHQGVKAPFLVVCPTTVLSHWSQKISLHAPALKASVFHGGERNLEEALKEGDVLLTSYGILRNDIEELRRIPFSVVVFDEIQNIKNPQTLGHEAARNLKVGMKLGLTGTPIENSLNELKALLDLTVPGYLGTDEDFLSRYVKPIETDPGSEKRQALSRLISPFTLRRLKKTVLEELPKKIEDIRMCTLSDDQIKLYRDAVSSRGEGLVDVLKKGEEPIPYIHIFALLNLLKQICDHPALIERRVEDFERYQSGKWELFKELVSESLESGQKVVIYSQFLGMIKMMEHFLEAAGAGFVTLTGSSRKRGEIIRRFNEDPDCRVYVGSLKAGGAGIDLVAASVVIHYDRWWNAAKEDQATDRVHRIGQRRGVQVFKLVTEGTLEEKIAAIIDKKRNLMDSIITEDDPGLLKTFSREELIEMLSVPS